MDEHNLHGNFMSILSESHPGLTFEEYRDCCVFLLFYNYMCIRFDEQLIEEHKLEEMVHIAVRGKLQINSFLDFIDQAAGPIHALCPQFHLKEFSFYRRLHGNYAQEKKKSLARFIRKLIKKMNAWEEKELLLEQYGKYFAQLMYEFAKLKKETHISDTALSLFEIFLNESSSKEYAYLFQPHFEYGILLNHLMKDQKNIHLFGYDSNLEYQEIFSLICYYNGISNEYIHLYGEEDWPHDGRYIEKMDGISIYMPQGVNQGQLVSGSYDISGSKELLRIMAKGEFPFLLSALSFLNKEGEMAVIMPSAMLYREGKETQIRKFLVEDKNWLDTVMILPDHIFDSVGQDEVLLYFKKNRPIQEVMFYDCSESNFDQEELEKIKESWSQRKNIAGYCRNVSIDALRENDFNLNIPRYISKNEIVEIVDLETRKNRIKEIEEELKIIEEKMMMYRRDLSII